MEAWNRSIQHVTRQSEMANTSPATCQCLATFTPLKSKMLIFFSWRHFSARSSCYIINWYGYPRGSHEKYLKRNCQSSFWDTLLNCYMLNVAHVRNDVKWRPIVNTFGTLIENMSKNPIVYYNVLDMSRTGCMTAIFLRFFDDFMSNINCGIWVLHVKRQILTYFLVTSFLCSALIFIVSVDRAYKEVSTKKY